MQRDAQRVVIHTLGRFAITSDGQALAFVGKTPHKPLDLLQALIALGGQDVSITLLVRAVWPGQDSIDPRNLLDNTLHRLRLLIGCRDALMLGDERLSLNPQRCWVDAWAFDEAAGAVLGDIDAPRGCSAADALRLYQGDFLQRETPRRWLMAYRERLRSRFERLLLHEGERLQSLQQWEAAAQWYERGLEVDPLIEHLHQRLILCRHMHGDDADAIRAYRRCRDLLWGALGTLPSPATQALASALAIGGGLPDLPHS